MKNEFVKVLYKTIYFFKYCEENLLKDRENILNLINEIRLSILSENLENRNFSINFDNSETTLKLFEKIQFIQKIHENNDEILSKIKKILNKTTDLEIFFGIILIYLCEKINENNLGLEIFFEFYLNYSKKILRIPDLTKEQKTQKITEFSILLLIFYSNLFENSVKISENSIEIPYSQYKISEHENKFCREICINSLQNINKNTEYNIIFENFNLNNKKSVEEIIKNGFEYLQNSEKYNENSKIQLILSDKIWDICLGFYFCSLTLSPEYIYTNVYSTEIFKIFAKPEKAIKARLAVINLIGNLLKCIIENYEITENLTLIYQQYISRLILTVKEENEILTIFDKSWASYWLIKINKMGNEELLILKEWFGKLSINQKEQLPENLHNCLSNINFS